MRCKPLEAFTEPPYDILDARGLLRQAMNDRAGRGFSMFSQQSGVQHTNTLGLPPLSPRSVGDEYMYKFALLPSS